jgi:chemotaxis protein CheD
MRLHPPSKPGSPTQTPMLSKARHETVSSHSHFLHAGQVFVSSAGQSIALILGSCVAVCIWDAVNGVGGAVHYLLPSWDGKGRPSPRYGNIAVSVLLQKLMEAGANRGQLRAKVFGGGCLFDSLREPSSNRENQLGNRNVAIALEMLAKALIPVISTAVGVDRGQRIVFRTTTGDAEIKVL